MIHLQRSAIRIYFFENQETAKKPKVVLSNVLFCPIRQAKIKRYFGNYAINQIQVTYPSIEDLCLKKGPTIIKKKSDTFFVCRFGFDSFTNVLQLLSVALMSGNE